MFPFLLQNRYSQEQVHCSGRVQIRESVSHTKRGGITLQKEKEHQILKSSWEEEKATGKFLSGFQWQKEKSEDVGLSSKIKRCSFMGRIAFLG